MLKAQPPTPTKPTTYLRFLTSLLLDYPISIYLDDQLVSKKLEYELFSNYMEVFSGNHSIKFVNTLTDDILLEKRINLRPYSIFTYTLGYKKSHDCSTFHLYTIEENFRLCAPDKCFIRLNHFAPSSNPVTLACEDVTPLPKNIAYGHNSRYLPLPPDSYNFSLTDFESSDTLIKPVKFKLKPGRFYSFYLLEDNLTPSTRQLLISIDGNSFLANKTSTN